MRDKITETDFTRINNDVNGNPRYVCHFVHFNNTAEARDYTGNFVERKYKQALARAKTLGGRKFHNKQYGGGIVFYSVFNLRRLVEKCNVVMESAEQFGGALQLSK